jgi:hypothetical protein
MTTPPLPMLMPSRRPCLGCDRPVQSAVTIMHTITLVNTTATSMKTWSLTAEFYSKTKANLNCILLAWAYLLVVVYAIVVQTVTLFRPFSGLILIWHVVKEGMPEHRNAGTPECRNTGMPEHRNIIFTLKENFKKYFKSIRNFLFKIN